MIRLWFVARSPCMRCRLAMAAARRKEEARGGERGWVRVGVGEGLSLAWAKPKKYMHARGTGCIDPTSERLVCLHLQQRFIHGWDGFTFQRPAFTLTYNTRVFRFACVRV